LPSLLSVNVPDIWASERIPIIINKIVMKTDLFFIYEKVIVLFIS
jgi:hypothetical protein